MNYIAGLYNRCIRKTHVHAKFNFRNIMDASESAGNKRRSRFSTLSASSGNSANDEETRLQEDLIIQRELDESQAKKQKTSALDITFNHSSTQDAIQAAAARAAEISKELNSKVISVIRYLKKYHNAQKFL